MYLVKKFMKIYQRKFGKTSSCLWARIDEEPSVLDVEKRWCCLTFLLF